MTEPIQLHVADLVGKDSIVAIAVDKDGSSTYYLLEVTSEGSVWEKMSLMIMGVILLLGDDALLKDISFKRQLN